MLVRRLVGLALVGLTALVGAPEVTVAAPDTVPVSFEAAALRPGESRSHDLPVQVRGTATVTDVDLTAQGAPALTWEAELCDAPGSCRDVDAGLVGTTLPGGTWVLTVTVTAGPDLQQGDRSQVEGHVAFQGADVVATGPGASAAPAGTGAARPLAMTGVPVLTWLALGLTATAGGAWLVVLGRRRRDDGTTGDRTTTGAAGA